VVEVNIPASVDDLQLVRSAREDPRAEEHLLRRVYPKIFQIARFAAGNRRQADDIAQIAAMEVVKSLGSFGGTGSVEAWAGRITYRVAMRTLKKESVRAQRLFPLSEDQVANDENPERSVYKRQLFETLISKMEKIPGKRRIPLLLHLAYGYTVSEVADMTEVSPNTVKDRLKTGYRELRTILEAHPNLRTAMLEEIS
jgi:RNA polymerase sigma-70 factor (ECF subfamily)